MAVFIGFGMGCAMIFLVKSLPIMLQGSSGLLIGVLVGLFIGKCSPPFNVNTGD
jgi:hypothetical protein